MSADRSVRSHALGMARQAIGDMASAGAEIERPTLASPAAPDFPAPRDPRPRHAPRFPRRPWRGDRIGRQPLCHVRVTSACSLLDEGPACRPNYPGTRNRISWYKFCHDGVPDTDCAGPETAARRIHPRPPREPGAGTLARPAAHARPAARGIGGARRHQRDLVRLDRARPRRAGLAAGAGPAGGGARFDPRGARLSVRTRRPARPAGSLPSS